MLSYFRSLSMWFSDLIHCLIDYFAGFRPQFFVSFLIRPSIFNAHKFYLPNIHASFLGNSIILGYGSALLQ